VPDTQSTGMALLIAAGFLQGAFMLPMKWAVAWAWENTWLVFAATAYLVCPWLFVLLTMPHVFHIYGAVSGGTLLTVMLYGLGWGVGAVTFGLGVDALGLALGFSTILGTSASAGTVIPMLTSGQRLSPARVAVTAVSLATMLGGVAVCSFAGRWREKDLNAEGRTGYWRGILICVVSGILSACGNLGFIAGAPITEAARRAGIPSDVASNAAWALLTAALFACNAGYAVFLLLRNGTLGRFRSPRSGWYAGCGMLMGLAWMSSFLLYGAATRRLGGTGASFGWAILLTMMVLTANLLGLATGEWTPAPAAARRRLAGGLVLLTAAIFGLGYANGMSN